MLLLILILRSMMTPQFRSPPYALTCNILGEKIICPYCIGRCLWMPWFLYL
ncbi:hypothetical protein AMTRI_Chr07g28070 [Amborella trichopoda]